MSLKYNQVTGFKIWLLIQLQLQVEKPVTEAMQIIFGINGFISSLNCVFCVRATN